MGTFSYLRAGWKNVNAIRGRNRLAENGATKKRGKESVSFRRADGTVGGNLLSSRVHRARSIFRVRSVHT